MEKRYTLKIDSAHAGKTVKQILTGEFRLGSGQIKKAKFRENGITVNNTQVTVRYVLKENDVLDVLIEDKSQASSHLIPMDGDLQVLKETEDYIAVSKPAGIVCHPSAGHYCDSMANLIVGYFAKRGEGYVVRLLGRLDKGTSGILMYAKNAPTLTEFERQRDRGILEKTYYAILCGCPDWDELDIDAPIGENPEIPMGMMVKPEAEGGQQARTHVKVIRKFQNAVNFSENGKTVWNFNGNDITEKSFNENAADSFSKGITLVQVKIETGRTHQIRVHMAYTGFPLLGDSMYGDYVSGNPLNGNPVYGDSMNEGESGSLSHHMLHAGKIGFREPGMRQKLSGQVPSAREDNQKCAGQKILCPAPEDFKNILQKCGFQQSDCTDPDQSQILL